MLICSCDTSLDSAPFCFLSPLWSDKELSVWEASKLCLNDEEGTKASQVSYSFCADRSHDCWKHSPNHVTVMRITAVQRITRRVGESEIILYFSSHFLCEVLEKWKCAKWGPGQAFSPPQLASPQLKYRRHDSATLSMAPGYAVNRDNQQLFNEEGKLMPTAEKVKITGELSRK